MVLAYLFQPVSCHSFLGLATLVLQVLRFSKLFPTSEPPYMPRMFFLLPFFVFSFFRSQFKYLIIEDFSEITPHPHSIILTHTYYFTTAFITSYLIVCLLICSCMSRDCLTIYQSISIFLLGIQHKLHSPASLAIRCNHVTKFCPMECRQKKTTSRNKAFQV